MFEFIIYLDLIDLKFFKVEERDKEPDGLL